MSVNLNNATYDNSDAQSIDFSTYSSCDRQLSRYPDPNIAHGWLQMDYVRLLIFFCISCARTTVTMWFLSKFLSHIHFMQCLFCCVLRNHSGCVCLADVAWILRLDIWWIHQCFISYLPALTSWTFVYPRSNKTYKAQIRLSTPYWRFAWQSQTIYVFSASQSFPAKEVGSTTLDHPWIDSLCRLNIISHLSLK